MLLVLVSINVFFPTPFSFLELIMSSYEFRPSRYFCFTQCLVWRKLESPVAGLISSFQLPPALGTVLGNSIHPPTHTLLGQFRNYSPFGQSFYISGEALSCHNSLFKWNHRSVARSPSCCFFLIFSAFINNSTLKPHRLWDFQLNHTIYP